MLFKVFIVIVLSALVISFLIWKSLVIFGTTGNKRLTDSKKTMRPIDVEELANAEEPVVICYKQ